MAKEPKITNPRIVNRRATHEYHLTAKLECGIVLTGTEVKSLRLGHAQLTDGYCKIERDGRLLLHGCHIDPYEKASAQANHIPLRERALLVHRREILKLQGELKQRGSTLIPLAIYFSKGMAKVEIAVGIGKKMHDKRETIRRKEQDREVRRAISQRR